MFDISTSEAMAVLYQMGTVNISLHWDDECTCPTDGEIDPLAHVKAGDPDPNADLTVNDVCAEWGPDGVMCTRPEFHPGQHIAGDFDTVLAAWL